MNSTKTTQQLNGSARSNFQNPAAWAIPGMVRESDMDVIERLVCNKQQITPTELNAKCRKRELVFARQLCMHFSKKHTKQSLAQIGYRFGGKDHATVLHANKTISNLYDTETKVKTIVDDIESCIKGNMDARPLYIFKNTGKLLNLIEKYASIGGGECWLMQDPYLTKVKMIAQEEDIQNIDIVSHIDDGSGEIKPVKFASFQYSELVDEQVCECWAFVLMNGNTIRVKRPQAEMKNIFITQI
jgi:hypothetical protein